MGGIAVYYRTSLAHRIEHLSTLSDAFSCSIKIRAPVPSDLPTIITGVYCPLDSHPDLVSHFYSSLAAVSHSIPPGSLHITSGDFNAHLGSLSGDVRPNGSHRTNSNQGPFLTHTQSHNLSILNLTHTHGQPTNISYSGSGGSSIIDYTTIPDNLTNFLSSFTLLPQFLGTIAHNVWQCISLEVPYSLPEAPSSSLLLSPSQQKIFRRDLLHPPNKPKPRSPYRFQR